MPGFRPVTPQGGNRGPGENRSGPTVQGPERCGDNAGTERNGRLATNTNEAAALDQPQQLCLKRRRHVADLVEEERPGTRALGITKMALLGARKGTFFVAENSLSRSSAGIAAQFTAMNGWELRDESR